MKDKKSFIKGQLKRVANKKAYEKWKKKLPNKPDCKDIIGFLAGGQLISDTQDELENKDAEINEYLKDKTNSDLYKLAFDLGSLNQIIQKPLIEKDCNDLLPLKEDPVENIICDRSPNYLANKKPEQVEAYERNREINNKYAAEILKTHNEELQKLVLDGGGDEVTASSIGYLKSQISLIKDYQLKDEQGCNDPYDGFENDILKDRDDAKVVKDKLVCDYGSDKFGLTFGKECYPQRYSCMDERQKRNFKKIKSFEKENPNDNSNNIKFHIYDKTSGEYTNDYDYKDGEYYQLENRNPETEDFQTVREQRGLKSNIKVETTRNPKYYIKVTDENKNTFFKHLDLNNDRTILDDRFQNPRYPHFRPTDQCSIQMQGGAGVCFQEAYRQHDLCFQSLPNVNGDNMEKNFNSCNDKFQNNIGKLCNANTKKGFWGLGKRVRCHSMKKIFYIGVQHGESVFKFHKGHSFNQSQLDAYRYKKVLYERLVDKYCDNVSREICDEIYRKQEQLSLLRKKYNLYQDEPKNVKREGNDEK